MAKGYKLDEDKVAEILQMYHSGQLSPESIAAEVQLGTATVYRVLRKAGIQVERSRKLVDKLSADDIDYIIDEYEKGGPVGVILEKYGWDHHQFYKVLRGLGVTPRSQTKEAVEAKVMREKIACDMYVAGVRLKKIRAETGYQYAALYFILEKHGIPLRTSLVSVPLPSDPAVQGPTT